MALSQAQHRQRLTKEALADIPRVPWSKIAPEVVYSLDPGSHMCMLGMSGSGKTTLAIDLLDRLCAPPTQGGRMAHAVAIGTKPRDETLKQTGWPIIRQWPPDYEQRAGRKVILWPPYSVPSRARGTTGPILANALDDIMLEGGWRLFVDEMAYLVESLGLRTVLDEYWNAARSSGISLIAATQRPAWLARSAVSQVDWVVCFRINDADDRNRAAEILGDRKRFAPVIGSLSKEKHEFLIVRDEHAVISWMD